MDRESMIDILVAVIVSSAITLTVVFVSVWLSYHACNARTVEIGMENRWSILSGCMIKNDGAWVPLSNYRVL